MPGELLDEAIRRLRERSLRLLGMAMMELHRDSAKVRRRTVLVLAVGVLCFSAPQLVALMGREFFLGPWFWYLGGGLMILASVAGFVISFRPFKLVATQESLTVRVDSLNATIPWTWIEALTVQRAPGASQTESPALILFPMPGVDLGVKLSYKFGGRNGYELLHLDEFVESPDQVLNVLHHYAGGKLVVLDAPSMAKR